jgi:NADH:ubiquinone oxidoreductase subunit H
MPLIANGSLPYLRRTQSYWLYATKIGPNRVGPKGWGQPIADALNLCLKKLFSQPKQIYIYSF